MTFLPNKAKVFLVKVFEKKATAIFATTVLHFVKWLSYDKKRFILLYYDTITIYINSKSKYTKSCIYLLSVYMKKAKTNFLLLLQSARSFRRIGRTEYECPITENQIYK